MGDLTPHFSSAEFRCPHCGRVPDRATLLHLARHLEALRRRAGRPLVIVSGYRCPAHNAAIGGARYSRHLVGDAVDLVVGVASVAMAEAAGFTGIGSDRRPGDPTAYARHVDLRPKRARWSYS